MQDNGENAHENAHKNAHEEQKQIEVTFKVEWIGVDFVRARAMCNQPGPDGNLLNETLNLEIGESITVAIPVKEAKDE